MNLEDLFLQH